MSAYSSSVGRGLYLLKNELDSFVPREFENHHQGQTIPALERIAGPVKDRQKPFADLKTRDLLTVMQAGWAGIFGPALPAADPELINRVATLNQSWTSQHSFTREEACAGLENIQQLLTAIPSPYADQLAALRQQCVERPTRPRPRPQAKPKPEPVPSPGCVAPPEPEPEPDPIPSPALAALLDGLRRSAALDEGDFIDQATRDKVAPVYADASPLAQLTPQLAQALQEIGRDRLYAHQAEAIDRALAGVNVVLDAPTASGKTLSFAVPMLETLLRNTGSHALMLYPMKAVANDQLLQLGDLLSRVGLTIKRYDGDTSPEKRSRIRHNPPSILVTNPEMLNRSILAHSQLWTAFLQNLRFVVLDEVHEYRGYFGSHIAVLLRRFAHQLARLNANPRYFLATATGENILEHAENLTGQPFAAVSAAGGMTPRRHYLFVDPERPGSPYSVKFQEKIAAAALACLEMDRAVLVFCPTRKFAERCCDLARRLGAERGLPENRIDLFRSGLRNDDRARVQAGMRDGSIKAVFSTNALEMGIDVGALDGVILAGFPDTIRAALQRIGRAGRGVDQEAFVLLFAMNDPMNRFYARNLPAFLAKRPGLLVADPANPEIIQAHLPSLLQETGGRVYSFSSGVLGAPVFEALRQRWETIDPAPDFPQGQVNLRGIAGGVWQLRAAGETIGSMSAYQQYREAYDRAIYLQAGVKFQVGQLEPAGEPAQAGVIHLTESPDLANLRTDPYFSRSVAIHRTFRSDPAANGVSTHWGDVALTETLTEVKVIDESVRRNARRHSPPDAEDDERVQEIYVPQRDTTWQSTGHSFWLDVAGLLYPGTAPAASVDGLADDRGLTELEQMLRVGTLFAFPVDTYDTTTHSQSGQVFLIESYPGGIGIAQKVFEQWRAILEAGLKLAKECACRAGCPHCLVPPRFFGRRLDKDKGITLAEQILAGAGSRTPKPAVNPAGH